MTEERRGRKETNIQALHSSGCLKGKARPLSIAAILMQESELFSGHSSSCREGERGLEKSSPSSDWMINDWWPDLLLITVKSRLIGQRDGNLCSFINTWQIMIDDRESDSVLVAATSKVTGALVCSRPAISKLLSVYVGPCVSCVWMTDRVCLFTLFVC